MHQMFGFFFPAISLNRQILLYVLYKIPQITASIYFIESPRLDCCFFPFSHSSHHGSWPGWLCLHQESCSTHPAGCYSSPGRDDNIGHHCGTHVSQSTEPVAPPNASSHAHPVTHIAPGENTGGNRAAEAPAISTDHQHVGAPAAGAGMTGKGHWTTCYCTQNGQSD